MNKCFVLEVLNRGGTFIGTARLKEFTDKAVQEKGYNNLKNLEI